MAKNFIQGGKRLKLSVTSGALSGAPEVAGDLAGVLLVDADSNDEAVVALEGVFDLAVTGADGSGNAAVAVGDKLYKDGTQINKDDTNGVFFGHALEAVSSGSTATINVRLKG